MSFYIILALGIILFLYLVLKDNSDTGSVDWSLCGGISLVATIFLLTIWICVTLSVSAIVGPDKKEESVQTTQMISLQDDTYVTGTFTLGSGSMEPVRVYSFYSRTSEGIVSNVVSGDVRIRHTNENPRAEKSTVVKSSSIMDKSWPISLPIREEEYWTLYVPPGTINHEFSLDS